MKLTKKQTKKLQAIVAKLRADDQLKVDGKVTTSIELSEDVSGTVTVDVHTYTYSKKFTVSVDIELKY